MHVGKNIGIGLIVLLPSVNTKLQGSDSKLPESGLCAHIVLKTCVVQGGHGKGMQLNIGSFYGGKNKTSISSPAS